jgi:hypothetical protein
VRTIAGGGRGEHRSGLLRLGHPGGSRPRVISHRAEPTGPWDILVFRRHHVRRSNDRISRELSSHILIRTRRQALCRTCARRLGGAPRQRQTPGVAGVKNDQLLHADFGALCSPMKHSWIPRHQRSTTRRIHELHERELPRRPLFVSLGASRRAMTQCHDLLNWRQSDWPRGAWQPLRDFPLNKGSTANRPPVAATVQAAKSKRMVNASQGRAEIVIGDGPAAAAVGPQSDVGSRWDTPPGLRANSANVTLA